MGLAETVGRIEGSKVGFFVGASAGSGNVGRIEGLKVGFFVGASVNCPPAESNGDLVGEELGVVMGLAETDCIKKNIVSKNEMNGENEIAYCILTFDGEKLELELGLADGPKDCEPLGLGKGELDGTLLGA